jgi:CHASE2 domain
LIAPVPAFYNKTMKRFYLLKESLLATVMILIITFSISYIPIKFEFTKPIRQGFLGFDIYDLYYSGKHLKNTTRDTNIVIVEIGNDRATIADQIILIQKYSPAVIGIDAVFDKEGEPLENIKLLQAIQQSNNIIFASKYDIDPVTGRPAFFHNFFEEKDHLYQSGYINILGSQFSVIRNYPPFLKVGDSVYSAFTSTIAKKNSPEKFNKLKKRNRKSLIIKETLKVILH